jgi:outer membrane protein assembly factor BamB
MHCRTAAVALFVSLTCSLSGAASGEDNSLAKEITQLAGVDRGLCVHLGCDDGRLAVDLARTGRFLVHGWTSDPKLAAKARDTIQSGGIYGPASVESGLLAQLPYADNLVNLVVVDDLATAAKQGLSFAEIQRVLAPRGVACVGQREGSARLSADELKTLVTKAGMNGAQIIEHSGIWAKFVKAASTEADEWTHYNYDPTGNRVSHDALAGPPGGIRWLAGPTWATDRNGPAAAVSAEGRLHYVANNAPDAERPQPFLYARDAYNGLPLWQQPLAGFEPLAMIASRDKLFTVVDRRGPLVAFDAATGGLPTTYEETGGAQWAILHGGRLIVSALARLKCLDAETGKRLWTNSDRPFSNTGTCTNVAAVGDDLFFVDAEQRAIGCLDLASGAQKWARDIASTLSAPEVEVGLCTIGKGTLVVGESGKRTHGKGIHAFSSRDGEHLWSRRYDLLRSGRGQRVKAASYREVFFLDGLFWMLEGDAVTRLGDAWQGVEPLTGKVKRQCDFPDDVRIADSCQIARATDRFLIGGHADFADVQAGDYAQRAEGVHGGCSFGMLPANGLIYTWSRYTSTYLRGEMGLEPVSATVSRHQNQAAEFPLERGSVESPEGGGEAQPDDWPCYRHDALRSSRTPAEIAARPGKLWEISIGGRLSPPTIAGGLVFVCAVDEHRVLAFDAESGRQRWSFTAGGRVPVPPTWYQGACLFGSDDGWVYCLRADDGRLVWRRRAAPLERRIVVHGQLESPWPVAGGVMVVDGVACFAAGRHGTLDGGAYVHAADPLTGEIVWTKHIEDGPVVRMLVGDGHTLGLAQKTGFTLPTGDEVRGPVASASAYDPDLLSLAGIIGAKSAAEAPTISGHVRAVLRTEAMVFAAGWPAAGDPQLTWAKPGRLIERRPEDHLEPQHAELWTFSIADGQRLHRVNLGRAPIFDGLAAAGRRLYLTTEAGTLICLGDTLHRDRRP